MKKLNEKEHQIIAKASIQELIKQLDLEVIDSGIEVRRQVSNRVDQWIKTTASAGRRIVVTDNPDGGHFADRDVWIRDQRAVNGNGWCPF